MNNDNNGNAMFIDYYEGAYGLTIRIESRTIQSLERLREIFLNLSQQQTKKYIIITGEEIVLQNIKSFTLELLPRNISIKCVYIEQDDIQGAVIHWCNTAEEWENCADLLEGLIKNDDPGHQYLTDEDKDGILIEVSFQER